MASESERPVFINHLIHETSPYLLQHAHNPVDWRPWGDEALRKAREEDKPIFLSIGYAACHWCHVMEHESFEDPVIAAFLNDHFVSIKVDREERPDLDEIYMAAVVALSGSGGWPMSVFLTPERKPFFGGTYYPPRDMYGRPGFLTLLQGIHDAWENRRTEINASAEGLTEYVTRQLTGVIAQESKEGIGPELIQNAVRDCAARYDARHGGWGGAPKFPSSGAIALLLREHARTNDAELLQMVTHTLEQMAYGGMYDQLGGGFHRYSVDAEWLVPHFEKMLYDNAQLSQVYLEAWQATKRPLYRRIATEIFEYELREMRDSRGGFHSTEDADSEGEEGKFYVWTKDSIVALLGPEDGPLFCRYYGVEADGNFSSHEPYHAGQNILHVPVPPTELAGQLGLTEAELEERMAPLRARAFAERAKRTRPGLDDKVLTGWNALMISALAQGARILEEPRYLGAAREAGRFILEHMTRDGALLRTHRHGESRLPGYLDDYVFTVNAFVDLYEASFDGAWLEAAGRLMDEAITRFWDDSLRSFYYTGSEHKDLLVRTRPTYDGAEPSGNSMGAYALLRLAKLRGNAGYAEKARALLEKNRAFMERVPQGYLRMLMAADFLVYPPKEIAIVGDPSADDTRALLRALGGRYVPNKVLALAKPGAVLSGIPLLDGKSMIGGKATAYVCKDFTCKIPAATPEEFAARLLE